MLDIDDPKTPVIWALFFIAVFILALILSNSEQAVPIAVNNTTGVTP